MTRNTTKVLKRVPIVAALTLVTAYVVDYSSVRLRARHATASNPYETLTAPRVYAISEKGQKTEYQIDADNPVQTVTCVHALFPHDGYAPCWQAQRTLHDPIPM
jgi:hypothetical protein